MFIKEEERFIIWTVVVGMVLLVLKVIECMGE